MDIEIDFKAITSRQYKILTQAFRRYVICFDSIESIYQYSTNQDWINLLNTLYKLLIFNKYITTGQELYIACQQYLSLDLKQTKKSSNPIFSIEEYMEIHRQAVLAEEEDEDYINITIENMLWELELNIPISFNSNDVMRIFFKDTAKWIFKEYNISMFTKLKPITSICYILTKTGIRDKNILQKLLKNKNKCQEFIFENHSIDKKSCNIFINKITGRK